MLERTLRLLSLPFLVVTLLLLAGCRADLPTYPEMDGPASLRVIADRLAQVKTIQSAASVELDDGQGHHIVLDAALAARPPDHLRLRAWKLDRAVFDATVRDGELWMVPPERAEDEARFADVDRVAAGIRHAFDLLGPGFFESARVDDASSTPKRLEATGNTESGVIAASIDRPTLTPRRFQVVEASGAGAPVVIMLDDYRDVKGIAWPARVTVERRDADNKPAGRVVIRLREIELNGEVQPAALTPPRRAVRRP